MNQIGTRLEETPAAAWPAGGGEMGARMRAFDWSKNPLGPVTLWPQSLKSIVEFTLASPLPTKLLWGPELIQLYNDPFAAIIGDKHPAGLGQRAVECWAEIMHLSAPYYARALAGEALVLHNKDWKIARHGMEDVSFMAYLTPVRDENGTIAGLHVVCIETTEQVKAAAERDRAEQALRYSETRLQTAADVVGLGCYSWNLRTDTQYWDFRARAVWGFPPEMRLEREAIRARIHPDDRVAVDNALIRCLDPASDRCYEIEYRISRYSDDAERWVKSRGRATFSDGSPVDVLSITTDITNTKQLDEALRARDARLTGMLEQLPLGVGLFDSEGQLQDANEEFRRHMDGDIIPSGDPSTESRWRAFDAEGNHLEQANPAARALRGETVKGVDFLHSSAEGKKRWARVSAAPFRGKDGRIAGALVTIQDVDREKRGEQARKASSRSPLL